MQLFKRLAAVLAVGAALMLAPALEAATPVVKPVTGLVRHTVSAKATTHKAAHHAKATTAVKHKKTVKKHHKTAKIAAKTAKPATKTAKATAKPATKLAAVKGKKTVAVKATKAPLTSKKTVTVKAKPGATGWKHHPQVV